MEKRKLTGKSEELTHVDESGKVHMVDVGAKDVTARAARAHARVSASDHALGLLARGELKKGDALAIARIAAIASVKKTPDLIPLCHPIAITGVKVSVEVVTGGVDIVATVRTADRTGIEMEALTAVTVGALNIVDMIKAVDRGAHIAFARIEHKEGGRSGTWSRSADGEMIHDDSAASTPAPEDPAGPAVPADAAGPRTSVGVLTISDRSSRGERADETGPYIAATAEDWGYATVRATVPDEVFAIRAAVQQLQADGAWLIVTTGGTGITPQDVTPEALEPLLTTQLPALTTALQATGIGKAAGALLTRSLAGLIGRTAVVALPGSPGAVRDGMDVIAQVREHLAAQLAGADHPAHSTKELAR